MSDGTRMYSDVTEDPDCGTEAMSNGSWRRRLVMTVPLADCSNGAIFSKGLTPKYFDSTRRNCSSNVTK